MRGDIISLYIKEVECKRQEDGVYKYHLGRKKERRGENEDRITTKSCIPLGGCITLAIIDGHISDGFCFFIS
jgi:hypothetical protein